MPNHDFGTSGVLCLAVVVMLVAMFYVGWPMLIGMALYLVTHWWFVRFLRRKALRHRRAARRHHR